MSEPKGPMAIDAALVQRLAELLDHTHLTEIEVEDGDRRIRVARKAASVAPAPSPAPVANPSAGMAPTQAAGEAAVTPAVDDGHKVPSPMVGTVYLSAEPGAKPFVSVGDTVAEGQTLMIIEAMKVMNTIAAPRAGQVTKICVENGQPVEYDQSLLLIA